jgi:hypothetical protein
MGGPSVLSLPVFVLLHVAAGVFYRVKPEGNLLHPTLSSDKELAVPLESSRDGAGSRFEALLLFGICVGCVAALVQWAK